MVLLDPLANALSTIKNAEAIGEELLYCQACSKNIATS
jgi:ribosomal protein S8